MAKFTFGAGNARVLLRAPLYLLGSLASTVVTRDERLWVFASGIGLGEGALELYRRARETMPTARLVWLCSSDEEVADARGRGMTAVSKSGWRGFRLTLRARVVVITHGFGDVNRYAVPGAFVVQLWHGIPLKMLHLDSPAALRLRPLPDHPLVRRLLSALYRRAGRQISVFPAASALAAGRLASAFGLAPEIMAVTGDPRNDVLLRPGESEVARGLLEKAIGALPSRVLLYAPTWRDGAADPGAPSDSEWASIAGWLEAHGATLLVRPHPLGIGDYVAGTRLSDRIRMFDPSVVREVMPVLAAIDVLITDYSSIAYDFALLDRPIVFFAPDLGSYDSSRGMYEPYRDFSGGTHVQSWTDVLMQLDHPDRSEPSHPAQLRAEHFDFVDGGATDRVLAEIAVRLDPGATHAARASSLARTEVDLVRVDADADEVPTLVVGGPVSAGAPRSGRLVGQRMRLIGDLVVAADRWTLSIPLTGSRWAGTLLAPPSGDYRLRLDDRAVSNAESASDRDGDLGFTSRVAVTAALPDPTLTPLFRISLSSNGTLDVRFDAPLRDDERGLERQRALERAYRRSAVAADPAVFFESFYSRVVACNPRAIDARLAVARPDIVRYWSTVDGSVAIPDGAVRVIEGTAEWWRARGESRLLVVNDWLRKRYRRRPRQHVFQTWHGTMLKRLALDRAGISARTKLAVVRESSRWDYLLAQNPHSAGIFRSAYRFRGEIWQEGYPRDDALLTGDAAAIRTRLGIAADARIVLYAPTWRDDRAEMVDYLDLVDFTDALNTAETGAPSAADPAAVSAPQIGAPLAVDLAAGTSGRSSAHATEASAERETIVLVRGHSRTIPYGRDREGTRLLDVTTYPDITDLLLVANILITDYSSLMFDFTATGKPIIFFTPDIRHYSEDLRGFYFDLHAEAPGPVVETPTELIAAVRSAERSALAHAERYAAWRSNYNPLDDGHAAERVVRRILDTGLLD